MIRQEISPLLTKVKQNSQASRNALTVQRKEQSEETNQKLRFKETYNPISFKSQQMIEGQTKNIIQCKGPGDKEEKSDSDDESEKVSEDDYDQSMSEEEPDWTPSDEDLALAEQDEKDDQMGVDPLFKRGPFWKETVDHAVTANRAANKGKLLCETCRKNVEGKILRKGHKRLSRGFDLDHFPKTWAKRVNKLQDKQARGLKVTRKRVIKKYNSKVRILCPECNQSHKYEIK